MYRKLKEFVLENLCEKGCPMRSAQVKRICHNGELYNECPSAYIQHIKKAVEKIEKVDCKYMWT